MGNKIIENGEVMKLYQRKSDDTAPIGQPDPFVFYWNRKYYIYATHKDGVQLYRSDYFDSGWEFCGFCFSIDGQEEYWAPSVIEIDNKFYLYVSSMPQGTTDAHEQSMKVATADSPEGPFQFVTDLLPPFSIDSHVITYKNALYIFYSMNDEEAQRPGTIIVLDKLITPFQVEGNPVAVIRPTIDEEISFYNRYQKGVHWHTVEGAFYMNKGDTQFITYSGSAYETSTYFVGYSVAHGDCDDLRDFEWIKYPSNNTYHPILCSNDFVEGCGHNSIIEINGEHWIVYHGRDVNAKTRVGDDRIMRADKLLINGDKLDVIIERA